MRKTEEKGDRQRRREIKRGEGRLTHRSSRMMQGPGIPRRLDHNFSPESYEIGLSSELSMDNCIPKIIEFAG